MKKKEFPYDALTIYKKADGYFYSLRNFKEIGNQTEVEIAVDEKTIFSILQNYCKAFSINSIDFSVKDFITVHSLDGPLLYVYFPVSSGVVSFLMQQYNLQRTSFLYENPNLKEIYLCGPSTTYSSYQIYQNKQILVFSFCFQASLFSDFFFLNQFLEASFSIRSSYIQLKEYCSCKENPYFYSLKKGNIQIYFDSFYQTMVFEHWENFKKRNGTIFQAVDGGMNDLHRIKKRKRK